VRGCAHPGPISQLLQMIPERMVALIEAFPVGGVIKMVIGESRNFPELARLWHDELAGQLLGALCDAIVRLPSDECEALICQLGGQINRVDVSATPYPHRDAEFVINVHTRWRDAGGDRKCIDWARALFDALAPHATGGVYVNFMPEDEAARVRGGAYGVNYDRLTRVKATYDPRNLFRMNQNVTPAP